jgi:hypothetical protein
MFGKDKINDPYDTMGAAPPQRSRKAESGTPRIRKSQVDKLRGANARLVGAYDMRNSTKRQRAHAAAQLREAIRESTPEEIAEVARHTGFTARFTN